MVDDGQNNDGQQQRAKKNVRTALILATVALLFYAGFILKTVMTQ